MYGLYVGSYVDFDSSPINVTFIPGETNKAVPIPLTCDRLIEGKEVFDISLSIISVSPNITTVELGHSKSIGIINDSTG